MSPARFALVPREGLFLKDGRGWYTSAVGRSHAHPWPQPSTVLGALRAAWGQRHMEHTRRFLPPRDWPGITEGLRLTRLLALRRPVGQHFLPEHRLWPVPADALHIREGQSLRVHPLEPQPLTGVCTLGPGATEGLESLWLPLGPERVKPARPPLFWTEHALRDWLLRPAPRLVEGQTPSRRLDVHVTLEARTQAAEPSRMFVSEVVEALDEQHGEWALGVECELPEAARDFPPEALGFGGRRRLARVEALESSIFDAAPRFPDGCTGLRLILATPAEFIEGWLPDGLRLEQERGRPVWVGQVPGSREEVVLRAALVPRPLHLSAWDMAAGRPRPTRRLVPAGAVYFFQKRNGQPFSSRELGEAWLAPWGRSRGEALGLVLPGSWHPPPPGDSGA